MRHFAIALVLVLVAGPVAASDFHFYGIATAASGEETTGRLTLRGVWLPQGPHSVGIQITADSGIEHLDTKEEIDLRGTLDWGYYQYDFGSARLRAGKIPNPFGLNQELRAERMPFGDPIIYTFGEGSTQGIEGGSFTVELGDFELTAFAGDVDERDFATEHRDIRGVQAWWKTTAWQLGFHHEVRTLRKARGVTPMAGTISSLSFVTFQGPWTVRAEAARTLLANFQFHAFPAPFDAGESRVLNGYLQVGYEASGHVEAWLQYEAQAEELLFGPLGWLPTTNTETLTAGLRLTVWKLSVTPYARWEDDATGGLRATLRF